MVVTDDQGRSVVPDLPNAKYTLWVRGYGLVDSPKVGGEPGKPLNLRAVPTPSDAAAAQYYPAIYWYSMLTIPEAGPGFRGIGENSAESSYYTWVDQHNTFGRGADVPISTANMNDGLVALKDGKMTVGAVPARLLREGIRRADRRPDRAPWLMEGGKGRKPIAVHFQLRPDPLAR